MAWIVWVDCSYLEPTGMRVAELIISSAGALAAKATQVVHVFSYRSRMTDL
jgi:hypothetical protein